MLRVDQQAGIATIELDRPPANAFTPDALESLEQALDRLESDRSTRVLIIHAKGRFFSAGADIKMMAEAHGTAGGPERLADLARLMQRVFQRIEDSPLPSLCAIDGIATGGGFELALACDIRIASESARIGLPECKIGLLPGAGGTQRLTRLAGAGVASRLILSGEIVDAGRAQALGLVHDIAPASGAFEAAKALAGGMLAAPRAALAAIKRCIAVAPSPHGYEVEVEETLGLQRDPETQALIRAFLERPARRAP